jgi:hypothetical protein
VKLGDDPIAASRYAMMMRRHARAQAGDSFTKKLVYDDRWIV